MRTYATTALAAALLAGSALLPAAAPASARAAAPPPPALGRCDPGQLCLWARAGFQGARQVHELKSVDVDSCVALPAGKTVQALANRMRRPVTTYESAECAETGEFQTYPGDGVWLPESPHQVRAFKVWER
ncbi:peptidase inhibitor family I36 protein [Streptomyces sp. NRRL S-87]|uniref:peptidase inhibitor family I36 protein n=1 Tax=Streptomyces sp. NRRL S-87 TaxID=1463920 RepID=UPI0004BEF39C|nr:peptidase inhibitor family I36 protein [Streptomyces sp. NRRL S-87]